MLSVFNVFALFYMLSIFGGLSQAQTTSTELIARPLPKYIGKGCSLADPNFNDCFIKKGHETIAFLLGGDPEYDIPKLEPLEIEQITVSQGAGIWFELNKCQIFGLRDLQIKNVYVDIKIHEGDISFFLDKLTIVSEYNISGNVHGTPVTGNGGANIELSNVTFSSIGKWRFDKKSNGLDYFTFTEVLIPFEASDLKIKLDGLFNGDKQLGDNINQLLNKHWREDLKGLVPAVGEAFGKMYKKIMRSFIENIPIKNLFPAH